MPKLVCTNTHEIRTKRSGCVDLLTTNHPQRNGSHDFDFLIGNWKESCPSPSDRLNNSNVWVEYNGISNHKKILESNANFEGFEVTSTDKKLHIKAQTLRLYNPT